MISFSSDVKSRMGVIIRPESEVYSTVQANIVEFEFPIGSVRGRGVRLNAGANQNRAAAVESRQRGGGCRPSLQAVPGGALSRAAATSSAGVHTEDHLEVGAGRASNARPLEVATGSASSMGESASTSATGASGGNFRVSLVSRSGEPAQTFLTSTSQQASRSTSLAAWAPTRLLGLGGAAQGRERRHAGTSIDPSASWNTGGGVERAEAEAPTKRRPCELRAQGMMLKSADSMALTAGRDRHKFCQLLQRFRPARAAERGKLGGWHPFRAGHGAWGDPRTASDRYAA